MENAQNREKTLKMGFAGHPPIGYNVLMQRANILLTTAMVTSMLVSAGARCEPTAPPPEENAFSANTEVLDVPTASTMYGRMFSLNLRMFQNGGLLLKGAASAKNTFIFGFSLLANNVIGRSNVTIPEDPKVLLKLRLFNDTKNGFQGAIGWDDSRYDTISEKGAPKTEYGTRGKGVYAVVSKDLNMSSFYLTAHGGLGVTGLRDGFKAEDDLNLFAGLTGSINEDFLVGLEYDDWLYTSKPSKDIKNGSFNAMVGFAWDVSLKLELGFKNLGQGSYSNRILKIVYTF